MITVTLLFTVYIRFYQRLVEATAFNRASRRTQNYKTLLHETLINSFDIGVILLPPNYTKPREVYIWGFKNMIGLVSLVMSGKLNHSWTEMMAGNLFRNRASFHASLALVAPSSSV